MTRAEALIHHAVERQAAARPSATAIVFRGERVTYAVLDGAANAYAAEFRRHGVGPGSVVAFLLPRSAQLIALQLGVLKCGGVYAGLDPRWPTQRIAAIVGLLAPALIVVSDQTSGCAAGCPAYLARDEDLATAASRATASPSSESAASAPATLFFTSGTTGLPKVVVSPHQAVTRMFQPGGLPGFGPGHATPQAAPLPWDMYAFEVWGQLVSGGTTIVVDEDFLMPGTLRDLIRRWSVDTLWLTTSLFNLFVDEDVECFGGLRRVFTGGEKLSSAHVRTFLTRHPDIPLHNGYGPAESCMLTTTRRLRLEDCDLPEGVPVGTAVPGTTVLVLDDSDRPCPPGEPGEVCIAGTGLACGYFGDPELTAAKFPTVEINGAPERIYRTGDLGLIDDSGVLHFRGRADRQVKISGHRVELEEIEIAVRRLPGVRACVALPVLGRHGEVSRITLFYTAEETSPSTEGDPLGVRAQLLRLLPGYMVPATVRGIERFPVTANGKIDAASLLGQPQPPRRVSRLSAAEASTA